MKIALDLKNLALYSGGIAHWINDFFPAWIESQPQDSFIGLLPNGEHTKQTQLKNALILGLPWQAWVPRQFRHLLYDNWYFAGAIQKIQPAMILSPYHDVRVPNKKSLIYSVITIHDLCFFEVPNSYPWAIRSYYQLMLRINLSRANHILTVSEATRRKLVEKFSVREESISVIPNALSTEFLEYQPSSDEIQKFRAQNGANESKLILYSGGIEYRKNIAKLLEAVRKLWSSGESINLCFTGNLNPQWKFLFTEAELACGRVRFLGRLSMNEMRIAYQAVDAVVYPSLCEGFGRPCIEAMMTGTPLACSQLSVFREVAGNYAHYFDPNNVQSIADGILLALQEGRKSPYFDSRYSISSVQDQFIQVMSGLSKNARRILEQRNTDNE